MAIDPNALASALPAGITYDIAEDDHYWLDAREIAAFQAERLAESGYWLMRPFDDETVDRVARRLCRWAWPDINPERKPCNDHRNEAREALAALREVQ